MIGPFTVTGDIEIQGRFAAVAPSCAVAMAEELDRLNLLLASYIVEGKLYGQVLNRRTGALADSIRVIKAVYTDDIVTGGVEQDASRAPYGRVHEFGKYIPVRLAKPGHPMHFFTSDGNEVFTMRREDLDSRCAPLCGRRLETSGPGYCQE